MVQAGGNPALRAGLCNCRKVLRREGTSPLSGRHILSGGGDWDEEKGIERTAFSNGQIIINHTSYPYEVQEAGEKLFQYPVNDTLLLPHSGVFVKKAEQQCV